MSQRTLFFAIVIIITVAAVWRFAATRVDRTKPEQVATAFVKAWKSENIDKASSYWVPADAIAWKATVDEQLHRLSSSMYTRVFENVPTEPVFTSSHGPKAPASEQTMNADGATLDVREIDGKWYVCKWSF